MDIAELQVTYSDLQELQREVDAALEERAHADAKAKSEELIELKVLAIEAASNWAKKSIEYGQVPPLLTGDDNVMSALVYGGFAYGVYTHTKPVASKKDKPRNGCLRATGRMLKVDHYRLGLSMKKAGRTL